MTVPALSDLGAFTDWILATDDHGLPRLGLLHEAEWVLRGEAKADPAARRALASRLERWRYQLLNERGAELASRDRQLADALDLAANQLAGRAPRLPRSARAAIRNPSSDGPEMEEARSCLDPHSDLDPIVRRAAELTREHFAPDGGNSTHHRMLLYAPLYLSNHCINYCLYCGFRYPNPIPRKHLSLDQALREAEILAGRGFRHILLVAGDFPALTKTEYFVEVLRALRAKGIAPSIEIAPQSTGSYQAMAEAGACGVTLYQETYNERLYAGYHPLGTKGSFDWRLEGHDRAAEAGMERLGFGFLLGLADPREDFLAMVRHARYIAARFPDRTLAFSLPRIHEAPAGFDVPFPVDDETFLRLYCALRIAFPRAELVLSTREPPALRDRLARVCITQISAGSSTAPGGYEDAVCGHQAGEQFPVCDRRSPAEVVASLESAGLQPVWDSPEEEPPSAPRK